MCGPPAGEASLGRWRMIGSSLIEGVGELSSLTSLSDSTDEGTVDAHDIDEVLRIVELDSEESSVETDALEDALLGRRLGRGG